MRARGAVAGGRATGVGLRRCYDPWLLGTGFVLAAGGLLMVGSATSYVALREWDQPSALFVRRGIHTVVAGLAFFVALRFPYRRLSGERLLRWLFWGCLVMLVAVFFFSPRGGAHRWLVLGPVRFQPSELVKLYAVLYVAARIARAMGSIDDLRETVLPCLVRIGLLTLLVLVEPDLGSSIVLIGIPVAMVFVAGLRPRYLLGAGALGLAGASAAVLIAPYRLRRVVEFVKYVLGINPPSYQLDQSLIALGSGGITGVGPGQSVQKAFFLPASHTDFIFSILGEELGLLGTLIVLGAFTVILLRGVRTALRTEEPFGAFLALGLTCLLVGQALVHMAVCLGMMPTTGLALPLVSYGGSSLVVSMAALGLLINVSEECNWVRPELSATGQNA